MKLIKEDLKNNDYYVDMFKIPLIHISSRNWVEKKRSLNILMKNQKSVETDFLKTTYFNQKPESTNDLCRKISSLFEDELKIYLEVNRLKNCHIAHAWFQQEDKNMFHEVHNHNFGVSVVCYMNYDPKIHTPTRFISPNNNVFCGTTEYFTPDNIVEGSIIFFPSIINHYTLPNVSDIPRKIVSWNMWVS